MNEENAMNKRRRTGLVGGTLLILLGLWFLLVQFVPEFEGLLNIEFSWPLFVIGVGVVLLILGLVTGEPGMAVPACIVGGIGLLLYYQNMTGNWASWAYAWTLIPGFAGVGAILAGLLGDKPKQSVKDGVNLILISAVMFVVFSSFLGGQNLLGPYWPVLLILLGLWFLIQPLFRRK
jgi:hypothetical protein